VLRDELEEEESDNYRVLTTNQLKVKASLVRKQLFHFSVSLSLLALLSREIIWNSGGPHFIFYRMTFLHIQPVVVTSWQRILLTINLEETSTILQLQPLHLYVYDHHIIEVFFKLLGVAGQDHDPRALKDPPYSLPTCLPVEQKGT